MCTQKTQIDSELLSSSSVFQLFLDLVYIPKALIYSCTTVDKKSQMEKHTVGQMCSQQKLNIRADSRNVSDRNVQQKVYQPHDVVRHLLVNLLHKLNISLSRTDVGYKNAFQCKQNQLKSTSVFSLLHCNRSPCKRSLQREEQKKERNKKLTFQVRL